MKPPIGIVGKAKGWKLSDAKVLPVAELKLDGYAIIERAVEEGLLYGWTRAHKHTDTPDKDELLEQQHMAIMNQIAEVMAHE